MSGLMVNFHDAGSSQSGEGFTKPMGNNKHKRFNKSRRFLERKGYLNDKQNKPHQRHGHCQNGKLGNQQHSTAKPFHRVGKVDLSKTEHPKFAPKPKDGASSSATAATIQTKLTFGSSQTKQLTTPAARPSSSLTTTSADTQPKPCLSTSQAQKQPAATAGNPAALSGLGRTVSYTSEGIVITQSASFGGMPHSGNPQKYLAIDCEMVGTGPKGKNSELARCSIVSYDGDIIYDKFIKPMNPVTDLRTRWSGIQWHNLRDATPFIEAKKEILKILSGKVVVGHAIHNDLKALKYSHPTGLTRDTSRIPLLNKKAGIPETDVASLKRLTKALFNRDIQVGKKGHSSVEDAKATMELYKMVAVEWERTLASKPFSK
ncbi:interferon-stimulated 20 kDa exonuclease-like 2 [Engraulis encrasicolus]|uniref:interferon-stimulated 20 kDa exonuclease-like 2 n=1 Tax=Engraulis encrasicolus TaxID=184585 RepID=UPI002FD4D698